MWVFFWYVFEFFCLFVKRQVDYCPFLKTSFWVKSNFQLVPYQEDTGLSGSTVIPDKTNIKYFILHKDWNICN